LLAAVTVLECDKMRTSDIEDYKILWTSKRKRTRSSRVAELIGKSKVLERVLIEKLAVPSLSTKVR